MKKVVFILAAALSIASCTKIQQVVDDAKGLVCPSEESSCCETSSLEEIWNTVQEEATAAYETVQEQIEDLKDNIGL